PKVGAWVVGGVILLTPILFLRLGMAGAFARAEGIPLLVVPASFLFVLVIILLAKAPKAAAGVIVAILVAVLAGLVFFIPVTRRQRTEQTLLYDQSAGRVTQILPEGVRYEKVNRDGLAIVKQVTLPGSGRASSEPSPIWSEGVEDEYVADVYPSRKAAIRSLGAQLQGWLQQAIAEANEPPRIVLFMEEHERSLLWELERSIEDALSGIRCSVEASLRNIDDDEIGITLRFDSVTTGRVPWAAEDRGPHLVSGRVSAKARSAWDEKTVSQDFIEKPWVEDFAQYVGEHPDRQLMVARSRGACTSENEARNQALRDATNQVSALVAQKWPGRPAQTISSADLLEGGLVVDQFVQSFDGLSGRFWREAMLIDTSAQKLGRLGSRMAAQVRVQRITWAGMILSALGVLVVIIVAYLFLNMATKGYYVWSLRIAGTVLAIAGVISILLVLR
ncbi:MAG: hypothetical protein ACYTAS_13380, partial [Planctomycetota bacterium]